MGSCTLVPWVMISDNVIWFANSCISELKTWVSVLFTHGSGKVPKVTSQMYPENRRELNSTQPGDLLGIVKACMVCQYFPLSQSLFVARKVSPTTQSSDQRLFHEPMYPSTASLVAFRAVRESESERSICRRCLDSWTPFFPELLLLCPEPLINFYCRS
jgi:hypothetical protein